MASQRKSGRVSRVLLFLLVAGAVLAAILWQRSQSFADQPLRAGQEEAVLLVEPGDGFNAVLAKLRGSGVGEGSDLEWKALAVTMRVADRLQAGEYAITAGMSPRELLARLARGEVIQRKFTIVEGWNFRELRKALQADERIGHELTELDDAALMARLERRGISPEGRFLPETYVYTRGTSDLQLLDRAAKAMDEVLAEAWESRAGDLPFKSAEEMLTLASIIEKETGVASERPMISGVFVRRLKIGMRLQTDPTVIYGMGSSYAGNIRKTDLERDTPYNTYVRAGLPPTPIAMPGKLAIQAAAHPAPGDALYFVASGNGGHYFSAGLDEHNAAVRKYQLKR